MKSRDFETLVSRLAGDRPEPSPEEGLDPGLPLESNRTRNKTTPTSPSEAHAVVNTDTKSM